MAADPPVPGRRQSASPVAVARRGAVAASAPPVSAVALTTPMSAFRTLVDVRMQCSFRHVGAVTLAAPVLNLRTSTDGFLCPSAEGATGFLWLRTYTCGYARIPVMSLVAGPLRTGFPRGRLEAVSPWERCLVWAGRPLRVVAPADPTPLLSGCARQEVLDGYCADLRGRCSGAIRGLE
jgi:hypothetical protein